MTLEARALRLNYNIDTTIRYRFKDLRILGYYTPADDGGRDYPSSPAEYELCEAWLGDEELTEFLTGDMWNEIETIVKGEGK